MDKEALIRDIFKIVDLESGHFEIDGLAKKHGIRKSELEKYLYQQEIILGGFGPPRLVGGLLAEAKEERQPEKN